MIELLTVLTVIGILVTMLVPTYESLKRKAERHSCASNLKGLYLAANSYVQEQGHWPQIPTRNFHSPGYAQAWQSALSPYSIGKKNWICPGVQRQMGGADYGKPGHERLDYFATPFDAHPRSPYKWSTQPWFAERGDVHGDGNLLIYTSGQVQSLKEAAKDSRFQTVSPF